MDRTLTQSYEGTNITEVQFVVKLPLGIWYMLCGKTY